MKTPALRLLALSTMISFLQVGCATRGFVKEDFRQRAEQQNPTFDNKQITTAFSKKSNLPKAFKLGVYFKPVPRDLPQETWRWTEQDRSELQELEALMRERGMAGEFVPILEDTVNGSDLNSIRLAAAQHQVDAVLVIGGTGMVERRINAWGWTYLLLAPVFFVPGSTAEGHFFSHATLWDVRNGYLYGGAESEGSIRDTYIGAFGESDKTVLAEAKSKSLRRLADDLKRRLVAQKQQ